MNKPEGMPNSERFWTPATIVSLSRPLLGAMTAYKLLKGDKHARWWAASAGVTDFVDGGVARTMDAVAPDSGLGSTEMGARIDPVTDTIVGLEMNGGALFAPQVSRTAKIAAGITLASEIRKAIWAIRANKRYKRETGHELIIHAGAKGKIGTASKLTSTGATVGTNDLEPGIARDVLGWGALVLAAFGAVMTEAAVREYKQELRQVG